MRRFYEKRGRECSSLSYKVIGLVSLAFFLVSTGVVLYFKDQVFFILIQIAGFCIITGGYLIPCALKISQHSLVRLLFSRQENVKAEDYNDSILEADFSINHREAEDGRNDYHAPYFAEAEKRKPAEEKQAGKGSCWPMLVSHTVLVVIVIFYVIIIGTPILRLTLRTHN